MKIQSKFGIRSLLVLLIALLTAAACGVSGFSLFYLGQQENDGQVINLAGRQRMLSQKMTKEAMAIAIAPDSSAPRQALQKTYDLFRQSHQDILQGNDTLGIPPLTDEAPLEQMKKVARTWLEFDRAIQKIMTSKTSEPPLKAALAEVMALNTQLLEETNTTVTLLEQSSKGKVSRLKGLLALGIILALAVATFAFYVVSVRVVRPLEVIVAMIEDLGRGQLGSRIKSTRNDELGVIANSLDQFADSMEHEILTAFEHLASGDFTFTAQGAIREPLAHANLTLNQTMGQIKQVAGSISDGALQIADSSQSLAQGASTQASSLEEISSAMTQISSQTKMTADHANKAQELSHSASTAAIDGNHQMQQMVAAMEEISVASQSVANVIKVIEEIAFQTNMLALNAAVEAAHAGQHGKGFAVVAEEVRSLAARSAKAAKETADLIAGSVAKTENGAKIADQTAASLVEITNRIGQASELVQGIAEAAREQSQGIDQVSQGLHQIDQVTQQNSAHAEEGAAASEELSGQASQLDQLMRSFKVADHGQGGIRRIGG